MFYTKNYSSNFTLTLWISLLSHGIPPAYSHAPILYHSESELNASQDNYWATRKAVHNGKLLKQGKFPVQWWHYHHQQARQRQTTFTSNEIINCLIQYQVKVKVAVNGSPEIQTIPLTLIKNNSWQGKLDPIYNDMKPDARTWFELFSFSYDFWHTSEKGETKWKIQQVQHRVSTVLHLAVMISPQTPSYLPTYLLWATCGPTWTLE